MYVRPELIQVQIKLMLFIGQNAVTLGRCGGGARSLKQAIFDQQLSN